MKAILCAAAVAVATMASSAASAQVFPGFYVNVGYGHWTSDEGGDDITLGTITGRVGARFMPFLGVEGEASFGIDDDEIDFGTGSSADVSLQNDFAAFLVGFFPISPQADLFARIGYGNLSTEVKSGGFTDEGDDDQFRVGVGGQFFFNRMAGVRADYTNIGWIDSDLDIDIFSLALVLRFGQ
jgi:outer membrane immunogenic protein